MKWQSVKSRVKDNTLWRLLLQIKKSFYRLSCCDLCGENVYTEESSSTEVTTELPAKKQTEPSAEQTLVCSYCLQNLPLFKQDVVYSNLLMWPAIHRGLPKIAFDHLFALSPYLPPFTHWLSQLKYQGRFEVANFFAAILSEQWLKSYQGVVPDLIVSVPLHLSKWQTRGYNQAHLIAKPFAEKIQLTYLPNAVIRIKDNSSQMGKTGTQRRKSLKNAFELNHNFTDIKHVVLLDDVVTTGTTASQISRLLKLAGVKTVTLVTVCLTLPNKQTLD